MDSSRFCGVLAPVITPFRQDLSVDTRLLLGHCRWLLSQGVGLAVLGTNSEANSLSTKEKRQILQTLCESGIAPDRLLPGTGSCALTDAVELTVHSVTLGCGGVLVLPPFYYKAITDDGLYGFYSELIQRVAHPGLRLYLYHMPSLAGVDISLPLIERLCADYPDIVAGIKDSSGDWHHTRQLHALGIDNFRVFCGSETFLLQNMQVGGAGCISATANVNPAGIVDLYQQWHSPQALQQQQRLATIRGVFQAYPMIPALKAAAGTCYGDKAWRRVRPPLVALSSEQRVGLQRELQQINFFLPGSSVGSTAT